MKLYYAEWPNGEVTIVHARNSLDLFWILDREGDPYQAKVWSTNDQCAITTSQVGEGLKINRDGDDDCVWRRVVMPGLAKACSVFVVAGDAEGNE